MVNTVIFDMDGVIVDTEPVHKYAFLKHFGQMGVQMGDEEYATYRGFSTLNVYQKLKGQYGLTEDPADMVKQKREIFNKAFDEKEDLELIPGVRKLIEDLYSQGFQLILATSASKVTLTRIFNRFKLFPYFKHIVSGEDFPNSKPNPAIFIEAARLSGEPNEHCIVIEDSRNGVLAANAANIFCVGYKGADSDQDLHTANMIINDFKELTPEKIRELA